LKQGRFDFGVRLIPEDSGNDHLWGGSGFDVLIGGHGDDTIHGGFGLNLAFGDTFTFEVSVGVNLAGKVDDDSEKSVIQGDPTEFFDFIHTTFVLTGDGEDTYHGGGDVDVVIGGGGKDTLNGEDGWDFLVGGGDDDTVDGGPGLSVELGGVIFGGHGDDLLIGGEQNDWLESEEGNDTFYGNGGNDVIRGGDGSDTLYGGDGDDQLFGEGGDDLLDGGNGNDVMTGGAGADRFEGGPGVNTIVDPEAGGVRVEQILVNGGASQRSNIETIAIQFSVGLDLQALINSGAIAQLITIDALRNLPGRIALAASAYRWNSQTRTLTIDLTTDGFGGLQTTRLHDDAYRLSISTDLDARFEDRDGVADGRHQFDFHRLAGDFNGDRIVNANDGAGWTGNAIIQFGAKRGTAGYNVAYDLDVDGVISSRDYYFWSRSLQGRTVV
jgi:Ca2+-binding RTX toxin-like protein